MPEISPHLYEFLLQLFQTAANLFCDYLKKMTPSHLHLFHLGTLNYAKGQYE